MPDAVITDAEGRVLCRINDCDQPSVVDGYCRYHYLLYWRKIQARRRLIGEGKLEKYIEELTARYPRKYLEMLKKDLFSEGDFLATVEELEIIDNNRGKNEADDASMIEEVRGVTASSGRSDPEY